MYVFKIYFSFPLAIKNCFDFTICSVLRQYLNIWTFSSWHYTLVIRLIVLKQPKTDTALY